MPEVTPGVCLPLDELLTAWRGVAGTKSIDGTPFGTMCLPPALEKLDKDVLQTSVFTPFSKFMAANADACFGTGRMYTEGLMYGALPVCPRTSAPVNPENLLREFLLGDPPMTWEPFVYNALQRGAHALTGAFCCGPDGKVDLARNAAFKAAVSKNTDATMALILQAEETLIGESLAWLLVNAPGALRTSAWLPGMLLTVKITGQFGEVTVDASAVSAFVSALLNNRAWLDSSYGPLVAARAAVEMGVVAGADITIRMLGPTTTGVRAYELAVHGANLAVTTKITGETDDTSKEVMQTLLNGLMPRVGKVGNSFMVSPSLTWAAKTSRLDMVKGLIVDVLGYNAKREATHGAVILNKKVLNPLLSGPGWDEFRGYNGGC